MDILILFYFVPVDICKLKICNYSSYVDHYRYYY